MRLDVERIPRTAAPAGQPSFAPVYTDLLRIVRTNAKRVGLVLLAVVAVVLAFGGLESLRARNGPDQRFVYYTVSRGELPIVVTEKGHLESQRVTEIRCELENISSSRSSVTGTQILFIVPNGKTVKEGELLVELDSAPLNERLDDQVLSYERANAEKLHATAKFKNQITRNETDLAEAKLGVELAKLALDMYEDGEDGTYQISLQELDLKAQEAKNKIREAQAGLLMQETNRNGIEMLYKLGYRGKGDRDQAVYKYLQAEDALVRATNGLATAISNLKKLDQYEHPMKKLELEAAKNTAENSLKQVILDNEAHYAMTQAAKTAADRAFDKEEERLEKYKEQLKKCKIYAPHDGMVVYSTDHSRNGSSSSIAEGAFVRQRQKILTLPDLTTMQVKTAVHESVLDQVGSGLRASIQIDAFPDRTYHGTVESVAVLPDQGGWLNSDIKVYETIVTIDEKVERLKPGMTAVVEIHVDRLQDVLCVPVQAFVQVGQDTWCYVSTSGGPQRRTVELGPTNDKFVEVRAGIKEGEQVLLNSMEIFDQTRKSGREISPEKVAPEEIGG